ncbi:type IV pilus modification protein PilV [Paracidovorax avenae]|uniref:type IV pilus modification protein PilV n=1 Tax=Paracidovorax avenae TaxID=80867 RepID=UPI000D227ABA|nr:type IV pilus modification protein PilV [Paracidovorax avenae]AVS93974.1 type IV pilus modification protein PilV [Paracidovorax avenae]AVT13476.1 type IV pilus modification protein PilV [Paracidovorax avenae]
MKKNHTGLTLIEMMVALVVLSIGLLGLAGLQAATAKYRINTSVRSAATGLVFDMSERIRVNADAAGPSFIQAGSFGSSAYAVSDDWDTQQAATFSVTKNCETEACTPTERATYDLAVWRGKVRNAMPQGAAMLSGNKRDGFMLTLMWFDKELNDGSADRTLLSSTTCDSSLTGMATQTCCPQEASAPAGVRCSRFSFVP